MPDNFVEVVSKAKPCFDFSSAFLHRKRPHRSSKSWTGYRSGWPNDHRKRIVAEVLLLRFFVSEVFCALAGRLKQIKIFNEDDGLLRSLLMAHSGVCLSYL